MKSRWPSHIFGCVSACIGLLLWFQLRSYYPMTMTQVHTQIAQLEKQIIPPDGTPLREVEAVYGKAGISPPPHFGEGTQDTLYWLYLLQPQDHMNFRAMLIMHMSKGKTFQNSINHACVLKSRRQIDLNSKQAVEGLQAALDAEDRKVLVDLLQIQHDYLRSLNNASWNQQPIQAASQSVHRQSNTLLSPTLPPSQHSATP